MNAELAADLNHLKAPSLQWICRSTSHEVAKYVDKIMWNCTNHCSRCQFHRYHATRLYGVVLIFCHHYSIRLGTLKFLIYWMTLSPNSSWMQTKLGSWLVLLLKNRKKYLKRNDIYNLGDFTTTSGFMWIGDPKASAIIMAYQLVTEKPKSKFCFHVKENKKRNKSYNLVFQ